MKAAHALLVPLAISMALSGCLEIFIGPQEVQPAAALPRDQWVTLPMPPVPPASGVLGLWVPENATGLRVYWPAARDVIDEGRTPRPEWTDEWPDYGGLGEYPPLLTVLGPEGERLFVGTERTVLDFEGVPTWPDLYGFDTLVATDAPNAGLYRIVLYGQQAPPAVDVRVAADGVAYPILPLPLEYDRALLSGSFPQPGSSSMTSTGEVQPPLGTVVVVPDMVGVGAGAHTRLTNTAGAVVAAADADVMRAPGANELLFGMDATQVTTHRSFAPENIDGGRLSFETDGVGDGYAFAFFGVATSLPPPAAVPLSAMDPGDLETVPLTGSVDGWGGAWFFLPPDSHVMVHGDGDSYSRRGFRIFDELGNRLYWGDADGKGPPIPLPAGRLLLVNDGSYDLRVELMGTAPVDAALHEAQTRNVRAPVRFTRDPAYETQEVTVDVGGPVVAFSNNVYFGYAQEMHLTVSQGDGPLASIPSYHEGGPPSGACCYVPGFAFQPGTGQWLDGGRYTLRIESTEAQGDMELYLESIALQPPSEEE